MSQLQYFRNAEFPIIVLSAPSGTGKSTIISSLLHDYTNFSFLISTTTRDIRGDEKDGVNYYFTSKGEFEKDIQNDMFLEWAKVHENYYGTSILELEKILFKEKKCPLLDIDVQGWKNIKSKLPLMVSIFISPPSIKVLRERLYNRNTDTKEIIEKRLEIAEEELKYRKQYDFSVINDSLEQSIQEIVNICSKYFRLQKKGSSL